MTSPESEPTPAQIKRLNAKGIFVFSSEKELAESKYARETLLEVPEIRLYTFEVDGRCYLVQFSRSSPVPRGMVAALTCGMTPKGPLILNAIVADLIEVSQCPVWQFAKHALTITIGKTPHVLHGGIGTGQRIRIPKELINPKVYERVVGNS